MAQARPLLEAPLAPSSSTSRVPWPRRPSRPLPWVHALAGLVAAALLLLAQPALAAHSPNVLASHTSFSRLPVRRLLQQPDGSTDTVFRSREAEAQDEAQGDYPYGEAAQGDPEARDSGPESAEDSLGEPQIALLFLARGPLPLHALWEAFLAQSRHRATVYVHASTPGFTLNDHVNRSSPFWGRQIERTRVEWGGLGMVKAELRLLVHALRDPRNQRFVLLSDSCIPIRGFEYVYSYLMGSKKSFIASYNSTWRLGGRKIERHIPRRMLRKGSQWVALTRAHAEMVANEKRYFRVFKEAGVRIPDETYMQTVVPMLDPAGVETRPVTYVQWLGYRLRREKLKRLGLSVPKLGHPRTFYDLDVSEWLLRDLQNRMQTAPERVSFRNFSQSVDCMLNGAPAPCFLFARKFAEDAVPKLMELRHVLGY